MSNLDLPPLPPDVGRLLDAERRLAPGDAASHDAIWRRVEHAVMFPPIGGGGGDAGPDGGGGAGLDPGVGGAMTGLATSNVARTLVLVGATAFAAGGVTGGVVTSQWLAPAPLVAEAAPPSARTASIGPLPSVASPAPTLALLAPTISETIDGTGVEHTLDDLAGVDPAPSGVAQAPTTLDREREVLDVARSAVRERLGDVALQAIDRHASEFPKGQLREEREALRVQALVLAGRQDEAVHQAAQFKKEYEESLLLPSVEQSVAGSKTP